MNLQEDTQLIVSPGALLKSSELVSKHVSDSFRGSTTAQEGHGSLQLEQLEQLVIEIIGNSHAPITGLQKICEAIGTAFSVSECWIEIKAVNPIAGQEVGWHCDTGIVYTDEQTSVLPILKHPALVRWSEPAQPLVIADLQTTFPDTQVTPSTEAMACHCWASGALLAVSLGHPSQLIGTLILLRSQPHVWTSWEVRGLHRVSHWVTMAVVQAQLKLKLQQQNQYQALLDQLTGAIRSHHPLDQVFQQAVEGVVNALHIQRGALLLFKYADPLLKSRQPNIVPRTRATIEFLYPLFCQRADAVNLSGLPEPEITTLTGSWLKQTFLASECALCRHMLVGQAESLLIPPLPGAEGALPNWSLPDMSTVPLLDLEQMPTLMLVPLKHQEMVLGCLVLQHHRQRFWQPEELGFAERVADQLSTAIIQTRTLRQVQALVDERTAQLQRSLDVQAKLYEKTRQQVEQLRHLNQVMEEFLDTMSHELRTPLTSMTLAIRMLREASLTPQQRDRYFEILERQCAHETNLVNDLLALKQLEFGEVSLLFQMVDVCQLVQDICRPFEETWSKKQLHLNLQLPDRPLFLRTDSDSLTRILKELLNNAGKYADRNSTVCLDLSHQLHQSNSQIVMSLSNVGSGITPKEMPYIFDKFRRGDGVTQQAIPGTGLGLALVKGLVEHLSGSIAASSVPLSNRSSWETCFTLTLPFSASALPL